MTVPFGGASVLVTGGQGFVGAHLCERLLAAAVALAVFLLLGMNLLAGVVTGGLALVTIVALLSS